MFLPVRLRSSVSVLGPFAAYLCNVARDELESFPAVYNKNQTKQDICKHTHKHAHKHADISHHNYRCWLKFENFMGKLEMLQKS